MSCIQERYDEYRTTTWSDMQEHLPRLFEAAHGVVLELGVRFGVSTTALLAGVEAHGGTVWSVDHDPECAQRFDHPQWRFIHAHSLDIETIRAAGLPDQLDLVFIDTVHTEEHTTAELELYGPMVKPGGAMMLHDTEDMATYPGVLNAIKAYCEPRGLNYTLISGSYGLGVIDLPKKRSRKKAV